MRKTYIDNIRWMTVVIVVIYHVIYMFNGVVTSGVIGPFAPVQYQDAFQYFVYPWFMLLLFVISGMSARFYLNGHSEKEFLKSRTTKLLVPSTIGLFVFWWILGYYNMLISGAFEKISAASKPLLYVIMAVSGTGVLWYIQLLWVVSLVLILVRKIEKDRLYGLCEKVNLPVLLCLTPVIWGAAQIFNTPVIVVYRHLRRGILPGIFYLFPRCGYGKTGKMVAPPFPDGAGPGDLLHSRLLGSTLCGAPGAGYIPVQRLRLDCHFGGSLCNEKVGQF